MKNAEKKKIHQDKNNIFPPKQCCSYESHLELQLPQFSYPANRAVLSYGKFK